MSSKVEIVENQKQPKLERAKELVMQNRIVRQYYVLSALFSVGGLSLISATYVTFLQQNGLNLLQVNLVNMVFYLTLFICEIPTGAFADIFGRKTSFMAACGLTSLGMITYGCVHTFAGFVLAETILAVGMTFRSGAFQAWLVDSLKHQGYDGEFRRIFARESIIRQICGGIGAVVGSYYLATTNQALPWFTGGVLMAVTTVLVYFTMKEEYFVRSSFSWKKGFTSMRNITVSSIRYGMNHRSVRFVLFITGIQIFAVQALNMYWQPLFREYGMGKQYLGFIFAGIMGATALGAWIISKTKCVGKEKQMIMWSQICTGVLVLVTVSVSGLPFIIIIFLLHEVPRGCLGPLIDSYIQKRIPSKERATITSFCAIAPHIGGAFGLVLSGLVAQRFGIPVAWIVSAVFLIVGTLLVAKNGRNHSGHDHKGGVSSD